MVLGFFRESLFVNINSLLYNKLYNENNPTGWYLLFLSNASYKTIYIAKWFITPVFACLFWFLQKHLLRIVFNEKKVVKWLGVLYLSLFLLAGIFFVAGWALGDVNKGYVFSRLFMGILQSPIACMILIPIAYLYKQSNVNQQ
ncbi:MAG TPA: hypothetical protein VKG26_14415 [Bacteroidia bacterium]|nr:hypothetical protein [Bacteroidia bacterium]